MKCKSFQRVRIVPFQAWIPRAIAIVFATSALAACGGHGAIPAPVPAAPGSYLPAPIDNTAQLSTGVAQPDIGAPRHVLTMDYFGSTTPSASASQMAKWLTWAIVDAAQSTALHDAGIKTMLYSNPNRVGPGDPEYTTNQATFAHDCSGHRIVDLLNRNKYLMQPSSAALAELWHDAVSVGGKFNAIFEDGADNASGTNALPCGFVQSTWSAMSVTLHANSGLVPDIVYNDLMYFTYDEGAFVPAPAMALNVNSIGGMAEGCYSRRESSIPKPANMYWVGFEDTEIMMARAGKLFFCRALNETKAADAVGLRLYAIASFLMTYNVQTSILSEKFDTADGFKVFPETTLVPTEPLIAEPLHVDRLMQRGGTYGRQYGRCYLSGVSVGPCAVVVNNHNSGSEPFPWRSTYKHTLVLSGGSILGGGTARVTGSAPPAEVQPETGIVAFR